MAYAKETLDNDLGITYRDIWKVPLAGGTPVKLTAATGFDTYTDPDVSPDFTKIAYVVIFGGSGPAELHVMNADGSGDTLLDSSSCSAPMWSPDGTKLVYRVSTSTKVINADGSGGATVVTKSQMRRPQWNRDGTLIGYQRDLSNPSSDELWVIAPDGSGDTQVATLATGGLAGLGYSWLHGSDVIVYGTGLSTGQVFKVNADGTGTTDITSGNIRPALTRYAMAPDDSVAFTAATFASPWALYQVPLNGSGESQVGTVTGFASVGIGQFWVYGNRIYTARSSDGSLVSVALDGTDLRVEDTPQNGPSIFETIMIQSQVQGV